MIEDALPGQSAQNEQSPAITHAMIAKIAGLILTRDRPPRHSLTAKEARLTEKEKYWRESERRFRLSWRSTGLHDLRSGMRHPRPTWTGLIRRVATPRALAVPR